MLAAGAVVDRLRIVAAAVKVGDGPSRRERALAEMLRTVAAVTRTGQSLERALALAGERGLASRSISHACLHASAAMRLGVPPATAVDDLARESGVPAARLFATVLAIHHRRGGDLGELCHRLARLLHERGRLDREARALTAQARFTARAVLALPAIAAMLWAWRAPTSLRALGEPGMLLLVTPAALLVVLGVTVIRMLAVSAVDQDRGTRRTGSRMSRAIESVAGGGSLALRSARCGGAALAMSCGAVAVAGGASLLLVVLGVLTVAFGVSWPILDRRRQRGDLLAIADEGLPAMLETSIALLAAGATPCETILAAIDACPGMLGEHLAVGAAQVRLGRRPESALGALPVVMASPGLDAWLHSLSIGAMHGAPVSDVLETLLRDARTEQRECFRARAATMGPRIQLAVVLLIVPAILWIVLLATATGLASQMQRAGVIG